MNSDLIQVFPGLSGAFCLAVFCLVLYWSWTIAGGTTVNIFGIGLPEMAVILVLALLIFGPKKLPEIGRSLGKAIRGFQEASKEFEAEFKREAEQLERVVKEPMEATLETPDQPVLSPSATDGAAQEAGSTESSASSEVAADPVSEAKVSG